LPNYNHNNINAIDFTARYKLSITNLIIIIICWLLQVKCTIWINGRHQKCFANSQNARGDKTMQRN